MLHSSSVKRAVGHDICHGVQFLGACALLVLSMLPLSAEYAETKMQDSSGVAKPRAGLSGRSVLSPHTKDIEAEKESSLHAEEQKEQRPRVWSTLLWSINKGVLSTPPAQANSRSSTAVQAGTRN